MKTATNAAFLKGCPLRIGADFELAVSADGGVMLIRQASFLVVDDSATMRRIVRGMLQSLGATHIDEADCGEVALSKIGAAEYTIIISDWNMTPVDGLSLLQAVARRQKPRANRFIFMTTDGSWGHRTSAKMNGADDFIVKPFEISALKEKVAKVLARM